MKPEESIKILRKRIDLIKQDWSDMADLVEYQKALERAVKALEKQIPRKPIDKTKPDDTASRAYENCNIIVCPTCGRRLKLKSKGNYCDKCGQRLDWGREGLNGF